MTSSAPETSKQHFAVLWAPHACPDGLYDSRPFVPKGGGLGDDDTKPSNTTPDGSALVPMVVPFRSSDAAQKWMTQLRTHAPLGVPVLAVYSDGACPKNGGKGCKGAGVGVYWADGDPRNVSRPTRGAPTNNVAELEALIDALEGMVRALTDAKARHPDRRCAWFVFTDSTYARDCTTVWVKGWRAAGWRTSAKKPVANQDLVRVAAGLYDALILMAPGAIMHVPAHSGVAGNEAADALGFAAARAMMI